MFNIYYSKYNQYTCPFKKVLSWNLWWDVSDIFVSERASYKTIFDDNIFMKGMQIYKCMFMCVCGSFKCQEQNKHAQNKNK